MPRLFADLGVAIDAQNPATLVLFPEMDATVDVPEITTACWGILKKSPDSVMCASSRMVVKRKGAARPAVVACTLLPYDPQFELGGIAGRERRRRPPQPSALRQVLRPGRCRLQPVETALDVVIPTLNAGATLAATLAALHGDLVDHDCRLRRRIDATIPSRSPDRPARLS